MEKIIAIGIAIFAGYWSFMGWFSYGLWVDNGPGPGFLPGTVGLLVFILALVGLFTKNNVPAFIVQKKNLIPILGVLILIAAISVFGMIISCGLFIIAWLLYIEKYPIKRASMIGVSTTVVIYFVFKFFLQVPFPKGLIGII